jgi:hypothetical protein
MLALELLNRQSSDVFSLGAGSLAQQFVPRADGYFDFFPKGMRKTGYRVDSGTRDRIIHLERGPDGLFVALIVIFVLVSLAARPLLDAVSSLRGLGLTLVAGLAMGIVVQISRRGVRRMTSGFLRDAPVVHMTEQDYRRLMVRRWKELPRRRMLLNLLWMFALVVLSTLAATGEISVLAWQRDGAIGLAVVIWAGILVLAYEVVRVWRWSRALR